MTMIEQLPIKDVDPQYVEATKRVEARYPRRTLDPRSQCGPIGYKAPRQPR